MLDSVRERLRAFGCKQTEHILYWISIWCLLGTGLAYIAAFYIAHVTGNEQLLQAVYYNAFAVYGAVWYLLFFISQTVQRVAARFDRQITGMKFRDAALYIAIVVLIVQYLLKLFVPGYRI